MKKFKLILLSLLISLSLIACSSTDIDVSDETNTTNDVVTESVSNSEDIPSESDVIVEDTQESEQSDDNNTLVLEDTSFETETEIEPEPEAETNIVESTLGFSINGSILTYLDDEYEIIVVSGGDQSGYRASNVAVDIGFGDRVYWGLTNENGQLVYVLAENIILQDDNTEPVNDDGRYYHDEADVPGTEHPDLDQGHVIADSLGGVANAYNITPQDSTLNRHGDQAYMEKVIRDAGGCTNFIATISYPDDSTHTPNKYRYEYILMGNAIVDEFENINPDEYNETHLNNTESAAEAIPPVTANTETGDLSKIDTNGNGTVTIAEAKAAGFQMPITSDHWLYQYMKDGDGDGMVGE